MNEVRDRLEFSSVGENEAERLSDKEVRAVASRSYFFLRRTK